MDDLVEMASEAASLSVTDPGSKVHRVYLALASFTSDYLQHQDVEERVVMPALEAAVGFPEVLAIQEAILGNMPPEEMAQGLAIMFPAMNIDDRATLLGGMRAGAPAEAFEGVWSLVGSVLDVAEHRALARRLDLD